jgi:hypothetical protein
LDSAISFYHQALALKPEDPFSTEMLNHALYDQISSKPTKKMSTVSSLSAQPKSRRTVEFSTPVESSAWNSNNDSRIRMDVSIES